MFIVYLEFPAGNVLPHMEISVQGIKIGTNGDDNDNANANKTDGDRKRGVANILTDDKAVLVREFSDYIMPVMNM